MIIIKQDIRMLQLLISFIAITLISCDNQEKIITCNSLDSLAFCTSGFKNKQLTAKRRYNDSSMIYGVVIFDIKNDTLFEMNFSRDRSYFLKNTNSNSAGFLNQKMRNYSIIKQSAFINFDSTLNVFIKDITPLTKIMEKNKIREVRNKNGVIIIQDYCNERFYITCSN